MPRNLITGAGPWGLTSEENAELKAAIDSKFVSEYLERYPDASKEDILVHVGMRMEWINCDKEVIKSTQNALASFFATRPPEVGIGTIEGGGE